MGYLTNYSVRIFPNNALVRAVMEDETFGYAIVPDADSYKWYEHESDMAEFSKMYPEILFELTGEGEDPGDLWRKYFKAGKMQSCPAQITYEPFDESKLR